MKIVITFNPEPAISYDEDILLLTQDEKYSLLYDALVLLKTESLNQYSIDECSDNN